MRKSTPLFCALLLSLSARRAWIEMLMWYQCNTVVKVALRKESVDRNTGAKLKDPGKIVALRKESVDRNAIAVDRFVYVCVALRKESVDRNNVKRARHIDV